MLRALKDLEFDRSMGKVSQADFDEMAARLRTRALSLMKQLDEDGSGLPDDHRARAERAARRARGRRRRSNHRLRPRPRRRRSTPGLCTCGTANDLDALFCKRCGTKLSADADEVAHRDDPDESAMTSRRAMLIAGRCSSASRFWRRPRAPTRSRCPIRKTIAGIPLPVADVAVGTVVVRVIRGTLANNIPDQQVELHRRRCAAHREDRRERPGRVRWPGARDEGHRDHDGPGRAAPVAGVPGAGRPAARDCCSSPPILTSRSGRLRIAAWRPRRRSPASSSSARSRDSSSSSGMAASRCSTSCSSSTPPGRRSMPPQPIVFELPTEATGVTILKDSSPQATAADGKVTVVGPFAPGVTNVQFAYSVPYSTGSLTVEQTAAGSARPRHRAGPEGGRHARHLRADDRAARDAGRWADVHRRAGPGPAGG